jgi:hypothetical protein
VFYLRSYILSRAWWRMPLIPALERQRQVNFWVRGQPGLQTEFQDSQGYTEKPWLENKTKEVIYCSNAFQAICHFPIRCNMHCFMLRPLIQLDLSFMQGDRCGSIGSILHSDIQLDEHHLLKFFFPHCIILASLWKYRCP